MKKLKLLTLLPTLALCACSSVYNPIGTYSFMLGKLDETHVRVAITLTDEDYIVKKDTEEVKKGKKFKAELDAGEISINVEDLGIPLPEGADVKEINRKINEYLNKLIKNIGGYYNISDYQTSYGNKLKLGLSILDIEGLEIPDEVLEHLIVSYIDGKYITLQIPVSIEDVLHQLTWYGLYFNISDPSGQYFYILDNNNLPGEQDSEKRLGTHPQTIYEDDGKTVKEDQVKEMNFRFGTEFSNTPVYIVDEETKATTLVGKITEVETTITTEGKEITKYTQYFHNLTVGSEKWLPSGDQFNCRLKIKNDYGYFDEDFDTYMIITREELVATGVSQIGFIKDKKEETKKLDRSYYMQKPFEFRDFHDIKMKLTKE